MRITMILRALGFALAFCFAGAATQPAAAQDNKVFKLGIVTFTSGPGAEATGLPAWYIAQRLTTALNEGGQLPKPYDKIGFGGMKVEVFVIDESGGTTKQVQELRNAYERNNYDAVIGYVSSSNCLAAAPVAEELKKLLLLFDCGTPRIFEDRDYQYVFRTNAHATMDNVALVRYLQKRKKKTDTIAGINPDYAYGRDNWKDFSQSLQKLNPNAKTGSELWPKLGAGQYGTEISALLQSKPDVIHTSLWGGDLQAFILQAAPRGLFKQSQFAIVAADHVFHPLGNRMPEGLIVGARGVLGPFAQKSALNDWLLANTEKHEPGVLPSQSHYRMSQAILGLKSAIEKAMEKNGNVRPTTEQIAEALTGLEWDTPSGKIRMVLGKGHQGIQANAIGVTKWDPKTNKVSVTDVEIFAAECVNPPPGVKSEEWIAQGFPGAKCN